MSNLIVRVLEFDQLLVLTSHNFSFLFYITQKFAYYPVLETYPNYNENSEFVSLLPVPTTSNDIIDNQLLYCVYQGLVSHLQIYLRAKNPYHRRQFQLHQKIRL